MSIPKRLAGTELEIMSGVWYFDKPFTVRALHQHLYPNNEKAFTTLQTMLGILHKKGFLNREKIAQSYMYTPKISKEEFARLETNNMISRIFHGSFGAFAHFLVNSSDLSSNDLDKLRQIIDEKDESDDANREGRVCSKRSVYRIRNV